MSPQKDQEYFCDGITEDLINRLSNIGRDKLIKMRAKVVRHAKYVTFQMAEVAIPRNLFAMILEKIAQLRLLPGTG
jgi:TolB-like protein